jgi:Protein of unknown function (DUF1001).
MASLATKLAQCLAGEFSNQAQAIAEPAWYVNLRLWQVPIPYGVLGCHALFAEQANVLELGKPYRQRVLAVREQHGKLQVQYYALQNPSLWRGAGADRPRIAQLQPSDLLPLAGCLLDVAYDGQCFDAKLAEGCQCFFHYQNQLRQVYLGFRTDGQELVSYDKGIDPQTGAALWGAIAGGYEFRKIQFLPLA